MERTDVTYSARLGAVCPACGRRRATTIKSDPWIEGDGGVWHRQRWHCCPLCGLRFPSFQSVRE